jgi:hypothetical protein
MKKLVLPSIFFFCISLSFCSKKERLNIHENEIISSGETDTYPPEADPWSAAKNSSNPLDANGYYHNTNLDYIFNHIGTDSSHQNLYNKSLDL